MTTELQRSTCERSTQLRKLSREILCKLSCECTNIVIALLPDVDYKPHVVGEWDVGDETPIGERLTKARILRRGSAPPVYEAFPTLNLEVDSTRTTEFLDFRTANTESVRIASRASPSRSKTTKSRAHLLPTTGRALLMQAAHRPKPAFLNFYRQSPANNPHIHSRNTNS